ncbi:MAG: biotin--[acetyl-CoA-carboxylase] ligase [Flavobacteriales bacterium]|nr:biotin--[acetyl-CoA-carboxylase] ligase [Flavobacteriales bacterium]
MLYFGKNRVHCTKVDSTNEELKRIFSQKDLENGTLLTAEFQTGGKGQMGSKWESEYGNNFLGTFFLRSSMPLSDLFALNMMASLAILETIKELVKTNVEIKWPNDILVNGDKIAGVLIENKYKNGSLIGSFLGIGLNLNQQSFDKFKRPATSLIKQGVTLKNREVIVERICFHLQQFYSLYNLKGFETINFIYHQELYLKGEEHAYLVGKETRFFTLQSVNKQGDLQLFNQFGKLEEFGLKAIQFLI